MPEALWGWGGDSTLNALTDPEVVPSFQSVVAREIYADCDTELTIQAILDGDTLDKNPALARNYRTQRFRFIGLLLLLCAGPLTLALFFVVRAQRHKSRRARRRK